MLQVRSWLDDWETEATQAREAMAAAAADDYRFAENNPFLDVSHTPYPPQALLCRHLLQASLWHNSRGNIGVRPYPLCMTEVFKPEGVACVLSRITGPAG